MERRADQDTWLAIVVGKQKGCSGMGKKIKLHDGKFRFESLAIFRDKKRVVVSWLYYPKRPFPNKIIVSTVIPNEKKGFDPHFTNKLVLARFRATESGLYDACKYAERKSLGES